MRSVTEKEVKKDTVDLLIDGLHVLGTVQKTIPFTKFYSKFRAYLFINFGGLALLCLMSCVKCLLSGENDNFPLAGFSIIVAVAFGMICCALWKGVEKKIPENERKLVFWGFFSMGVLTVGKLLLCLTIILIPLVLHMGGEYNYVYRHVDEGEHAGEMVLMRYKLNGQLEDIYGNIYEE